MTTLADYRGRTSDLLAFQGVFPFAREQLLAQQLVSADGSSYVVTGIQKLAQKFLVVLLTKLGSKSFFPNDGTSFMADAQQGRWRTVADVEQSFYAARLSVRRQITEEEADDDPDDERYGDAVLSGVVLNDDTVSVRIALTSLAGTTYQLVTPINIVPHG